MEAILLGCARSSVNGLSRETWFYTQMKHLRTSVANFNCLVEHDGYASKGTTILLFVHWFMLLSNGCTVYVKSNFFS